MSWPRLPRRARRLLALLAAGALAACGPPAGEERPPAPPSFVLVVVDTLRNDRLHFAGHEQETPGFDALEAESVSFTQAWATSSWTLPSTASLLLSQLPTEHGVTHWGSILGEGPESLAGALRGAGYRTGMFTANRIVATNRGIGARFDHFELVEHPDFRGELVSVAAFGSARQVIDRALDWLGRGDAASQPFFAYLHVMEPHSPYLCASRAPISCRRRALHLNNKLLRREWDLDAREREMLRVLYDADVDRVDGALAMLVEELDARGGDPPWLVVTSDHGELLGEDGMYLHGRTLLEPLLHVPLLFRAPDRHAARVTTPVSLVDVAPTILDLAGISAPASFRGRSLRPALDGGGIEARPVVAELHQLRPVADPLRRHVVAVRRGPEKYLLAPDLSLQRFDLASDPAETRPLEADRARFEALLGEAGVDFDADAYSVGDLPSPTPEMLEQLRRLGYLEEE